MKPYTKRTLRPGSRLMSLLSISLIAFLAGSALPGLAQTEKPAAPPTKTEPVKIEEVKTPVALQRKFVKGEVDRYKVFFKALISTPQTGSDDIEIALTATLQETIKDLKPDGTVVIYDEVVKAVVNAKDGENNVTQLMPTITQTRDKDGKLKDVKLENDDNPLAMAMGNILQLVLRSQLNFYNAKPVASGSTWSLELTEQKQNNIQTDTGKATFEGLEKVKDVDTYRVKVVRDTVATTADAAEQKNSKSLKIHFEGTGNLALDTGKILHATGKISGDLQQMKSGTFIVRLMAADDEPDTKPKPADDKPDKTKKEPAAKP